MIKFAVATKAPAVKSQPLLLLSYVLGLGTAVLAVAQMVSFEEFVEALQAYQVTGERGTVALAVLLTALEIFSVPFLLRLSLSPAARFVSAFFTLVLPLAWLAMTMHALMANLSIDNAGYFGGFLTLHVGAAVLVLNVVWAAAVAGSFGPLGGSKALRPKL